MVFKDFIELEYASLGDGQTKAGELCPACSGGTSRERTLSVSRQGGRLLWTCHRASCSFKGSNTSRSISNASPISAREVRGIVGRDLVRSASALPKEAEAFLRDHYNITDSQFSREGIGWVQDRITLPVRDFKGELRGVVLRSLSGAKPKTLTHTESGAISWHVNRTTPALVIVEDQLSAIRASDYLTSVALLGTHLNDDRVTEIKASGLSPVYLALDADAWDQAVRLAMKYRSRLPMRLLKLTKDIKDMDNEECDELFQSI